ncbi:MAG: adenylate/guanylate cyclase domain-containing protein [Zoogloeaceae bacterium]|nr:adenylate/guanylate cyclase domain-containing protein [Zoogloeaceae bacterium]
MASLLNDRPDEYSRHHFQESLGQVRFALMLGAPMYLAFLVWDYSIDPAHILDTTYIRIAVAVILVATYALTFRESFEQASQLVLASCAVVAGLGVIYVLHTLENGMVLGVAGVILILMYVYGFLRLRFVPSVVSGVAIWLAYDVVAIIDQLGTTELVNSNFFLAGATIFGISNSFNQERLGRRAFLYMKEVEREKARADQLLSQIFPAHIKNRLTAGERVIADSNSEVTVVFADLVGFSSLTKRLTPGHLVELLDKLFSAFDDISEKFGVEKIKTIGDSYMAVSGLAGSVARNTETILDMTLELVAAVDRVSKAERIPIGVRVGVATGHAVSGVLGAKRNHFDVWGETVNIASRMEASGIEGKVQVSEQTYWRYNQSFEFEERGEIEVKGHGKLKTYILIGRHCDKLHEAMAPAGPTH